MRLYFYLFFSLLSLSPFAQSIENPKMLKVGVAMGAATITTEKLVYAKSVGIDYIEVSINVQADHTNLCFTDGDDSMEKLLADIKKAADNAGIKIWSIHMPYGSNIDLSLTDETARKKVVDFQKKAIEMLAVLQPQYILFHPSHHLGLNERPARINSLLKSVKEIKPKVESIDAHIVIENLLGAELLKDATHERPLCRTVEEMLSIMSMMDDDVYSIVDLNHIKNPEKLILALGHRLKSLHVSDGDGLKECHYVPCEGLGTVDWTAVLSALDQVGYDGPFMYEVKKYNNLKDLPECYNSLYKSYCGKQVYPAAVFTQSGKSWTYKQDFNSLPSANNLVEPKYFTFERGKTINGWFAGSSQNIAYSYKADNGSYFYGTSMISYGNLYKKFGGKGDKDRALGCVCSVGGSTNFGIILQNNTGSIINELSITYTGEAWKQGTENNKNQGGLTFSYEKKPSDYISAKTSKKSTAVDALNFIPTCAGTADYTDIKVLLPLDGNADQNRSIKTFRLTNLNLGCNETILLRWDQKVVTSTPLTAQWGLAIDDLTITVTDDIP